METLEALTTGAAHPCTPAEAGEAAAAGPDTDMRVAAVAAAVGYEAAYFVRVEACFALAGVCSAHVVVGCTSHDAVRKSSRS